MKLIHLSDLHLGKRLNEFSLLEDQAYILNEIVGIVARERPDVLLIAGDIYDKPVPPADAVELLDDFLVRLSELGVPVVIISGNHDSAERLSFAGRLMESSHVYIAPAYDGRIHSLTLGDGYGDVTIHMLPFIKPVHVRRFYPDAGVISYTDAVKCAIDSAGIDMTRRNILVTHQLVTGSKRCDSEEISIGGSDNVDLAAFDGFDYVALGHIHGSQSFDGGRMRYCGTPLKYSFSEIDHKKSVTIAELGQKGSLDIREIPLIPKRELICLRGSYMEIMSPEFYKDIDRESYVRVILTDEDEMPDAIGKLRIVYPNIMRMEYDNRRSRAAGAMASAPEMTRTMSPEEVFADLYRRQNGGDMSGKQAEYISSLIKDIWEDNI